MYQSFWGHTIRTAQQLLLAVTGMLGFWFTKAYGNGRVFGLPKLMYITLRTAQPTPTPPLDFDAFLGSDPASTVNDVTCLWYFSKNMRARLVLLVQSLAASSSSLNASRVTRVLPVGSVGVFKKFLRVTDADMRDKMQRGMTMERDERVRVWGTGRR